MSDKLVESLKFVSGLVQQAAGAAVKVSRLDVPGLPAHRLVLVDDDGFVDWVSLPPPLRDHELGSLDDVLAYVQFLMGTKLLIKDIIAASEDPEDKEAAQKVARELPQGCPIVFYNGAQVTVVVDDRERREFATLPLCTSPQYRTILELEGTPGAAKRQWNQRDFRRLLRVDLAGCFATPELLNYVSSVKFTSGTVTQGNLARNKESMGLDLQAEVNGGVECPDFVQLNIPVFDNVGLRAWTYPVTCVFEVDVTQQTFMLMPIPMSSRDILDRAVSDIGKKLAEAPCPVFRGSFE